MWLSGNEMGWRVEGPEFDSGQNLLPSFSVALSRRVPPTDLCTLLQEINAPWN